MPGVWFALRKSLLCKSKASDVRDLDFNGNLDPFPKSMPERSTYVGCLANLKEVIHRRTKNNKKLSICSSKVDESRAEYSNPIVGNKIVLDNSRRSFRTTCPGVKGVSGSGGHGHRMLIYELRKSLSESSSKYQGGSTSSVCQICGEQHKHSAAIEPHRLKHAVSELMEGDSSRKIVEIICQTGQRDTNNNNNNNNEYNKIERILKVHNMENILAWFEDYREMVKTKASKQSDHKENPRCLADGNELLRFYATTILCSFGMNGCSSLCKSINCGACRIMRNGFFTRRDFLGHVGIFTTANSERALRYSCDQEGQFKRKALFVCRVIAGKIESPVRKIEKGRFSAGSGFDSLAWKVSRNKNAEELFLLNPRALLPCFVVIYTN